MFSFTLGWAFAYACAAGTRLESTHTVSGPEDWAACEKPSLVPPPDDPLPRPSWTAGRTGCADDRSHGYLHYVVQSPSPPARPGGGYDQLCVLPMGTLRLAPGAVQPGKEAACPGVV